MKENNVKVGIGVFVFRDGKFLMQHRHGAHGAGTWAPPGGHLEFGESFEEVARREVREETSLEIKNIRFGAVTNDYFTKENKHYVTVWMLSDWKSGETRIMEPEKCLEQRWCTFSDVPSPLFLSWKRLMESEFIDKIKRFN
jgi:8-oxo-dGTP diphosphatase